ncbi:MAG: ATP-binding cassette domain-containing protein [Candidatus Pseudobacter hemicellulosilyticus]|uniref:ATP-binding cassette domain-containing protein n=1 Tax=Candidatus Pseudobacter hemicellulosilyticus TaxID=3121375 RepID=A0AAJ6BF74_9BACT|nr:MAG: ATP-binding cassette domain-containing protein [Pseudobacter sp.]
MDKTLLLQLDNVSVKLGATPVLKNINLQLHRQEQLAIIGPSGSGKTVLAHTLAGRHFFSGQLIAGFGTPETFHRQVMVVEQQHRFKDLSNQSNFYYQQRYNSFDSEQTATVSQALAPYLDNQRDAETSQWLTLLQIDRLLDEPMIQLSNGENKRLQLAIALLQSPVLLILDHPFLGLDTAGRQLLHSILDQLPQRGIHLILITTPHELPACITLVATLEKGELSAPVPRASYQPPAHAAPAALFNGDQLRQLLPPASIDFNIAIQMKNVQVQYEGKIILQDVNWTVNKGECWSVSGQNGAGKSTLLSLISGDNPQAYSNEIYLFDKRRGSGESIWDIKRRIGYVSPELHLYFDYTATVFQTVASGLFDTIGLFRQLSSDQETTVQHWLQLLQLEPRANTLLSRLSASEQRLVLLARALVKNPPLLILDEPCQGLDESQVARFRELINQICHEAGTTLLYVSHYREEIPACVTRQLFLQKGKAPEIQVL